MNEHDSFLDSVFGEQMFLAERELSSFLAAVTDLYGPEEARSSAENWLDELELMEGPPRTEVRNWRAVTIAASARLANSKVASRTQRRTDPVLVVHTS